jgi:hypothetical protein
MQSGLYTVPSSEGPSTVVAVTEAEDDFGKRPTLTGDWLGA